MWIIMHLKKILKKKINTLSSSSLNVGQIEPHPKEVFFIIVNFSFILLPFSEAKQFIQVL